MQHCSYLQVLISTLGVLAIANRSISMQEQCVTVDDYSRDHGHRHHGLQEETSFLQVFLEQEPGRPPNAAWQRDDATARAEVPHPSMQEDGLWHTLQDSQRRYVLDQVPQPSTQGHDSWYGSGSQQSNIPSETIEMHPGLQFLEQWNVSPPTVAREVEKGAQANFPDQVPQSPVNWREEYTPKMLLTHDPLKLKDLSWPDQRSPSAQKQVSPPLSMIEEATQGTATIAEASTKSKFGAVAGAATDAQTQAATGSDQSSSGQVLLLSFIGTSIAYILLVFCLQHNTSAGQAQALNEGASKVPEEDEVENRKYEGLDEDTYRLAIVLLIRDGQNLAQHGYSPLRVTRIVGHHTLLMITIVIQVILLNEIKLYVTPQAVATIRSAYDEYELKMCGGVEKHTTLTVNGKHRCKPEFFKPDIFPSLSDDLKTDVCNIPFSQLKFFKLVLLIWSLTCVGQIKMCIETFLTLIIATPTSASMVDAMVLTHEEEFEPDGMPEKVIQGLTLPMKLLIFFTVLLPWFSTTTFLLALGSRWLTATNDFGDLILNAVGLEFILLLKDLVYVTLVAERNKRELRNTLVVPVVKKEPAGYWVFMSGMAWAIVAILWVYLYIFHWQRVLPEYKWDVHGVCTKWLHSLTVKPDLAKLKAAGIGSL